MTATIITSENVRATKKTLRHRTLTTQQLKKNELHKALNSFFSSGIRR